MSSTAPIFVMSSERSGSNLLRTLLSNHSAVAAPTAPQLLNSFRGAVRHFQPLDDEQNAAALIQALVAISNHPMFGWELELDPLELVRRERPGSLIEAFDALYRAKRDAEGARRYVCKENRLFDFADELLGLAPEARLIYLARDPRDYALSCQNVPLHNNTPHKAATCWHEEQALCLAVEQRHGERVHRLTYEGLIADPRAAMTAVLDHLDEEPEPACFEVQGAKNQGQAWSSFWKNLTQPVQSQNKAKYRQAFDASTLELIETLCAAEMEALGYAPETPQAWRAGLFFERRERKLAAENDRRLRAEHADTVAVIEDRLALFDRLIEARASS